MIGKRQRRKTGHRLDHDARGSNDTVLEYTPLHELQEEQAVLKSTRRVA